MLNFRMVNVKFKITKNKIDTTFKPMGNQMIQY